MYVIEFPCWGLEKENMRHRNLPFFFISIEKSRYARTHVQQGPTAHLLACTHLQPRGDENPASEPATTLEPWICRDCTFFNDSMCALAFCSVCLAPKRAEHDDTS